MRLVKLLIVLAIGGLLACPTLARGETADEAFARGDTLLEKGDFQEALRAYSIAVRADRTNQQYVQQFMLVRRIIVLRKNLDREKNSQRWQRTARALRSFYADEGIYPEALALDVKIHARTDSAFTATQLAETQLAMDMHAQAAQVLAALDPSKRTVATEALRGIALARQGEAGEARKIAEKIVLPAKVGPGTLYNLARMYASVGDHGEALRLLTRCFEAVAPSRLDRFKAHAKRSPEFARLASADAFTKVLQTESKVAESKCSGGSSCAGCPMRGGCPSGRNK